MKTKTFTTVVVALLIGITACGIVPRVQEQAALPASPAPTPQPMPDELGQDVMNVVLDGRDGHVELARDFFVRKAFV